MNEREIQPTSEQAETSESIDSQEIYEAPKSPESPKAPEWKIQHRGESAIEIDSD